MNTFRKSFPYLAALVAVGAMGWAVSFGTLPPADFTFINGTEIQSVDPAIVTGVPEGRIMNAIFEGLYRQLPSDDDPTVLVPKPAIAESHTVSADRKTYTFKIRESARWSNGEKITAHDMRFAWQRFLHPETASQYAYQLSSYVVGADKYNASQLVTGDRVEVELHDRRDPDQLYPRGSIVAGVLTDILKAAEPTPNPDASDDQLESEQAAWRNAWVYVVEVKPEDDGRIDWNAKGDVQYFSKDESTSVGNLTAELRQCHHVLLHFSQVGIEATDDMTFVVKLKNPTPYFLELCSFYPLYPVNRGCIEEFGYPQWTRPENLVCNGPYQLKFRRIRDRIRLVKNPNYWQADQVQLETIDALAVELQTTMLNMYIQGQADWTSDAPNSVVPELLKRDDFIAEPMLSVYYYRINVTHKPLDDVRVRRALNMAINKQDICDAVTRAGQKPARSVVPPGIANYHAPLTDDFNPTAAKALLAEVGFPSGKGFPKFELLYNTSDAHETIAQVIQQQWKQHLGIDVEPTSRAWSVYLNDVESMKYKIARAGWVGDYPDPNTFLDLWITDGTNNNTGWGNEAYDKLIKQAAAEPDPAKRLDLLRQAEEILVAELPIIPIYHYVSKNLVRPYVKNFNHNIQDLHPLHILEIDQEAKAEFWRQGGSK